MPPDRSWTGFVAEGYDVAYRVVVDGDLNNYGLPATRRFFATPAVETESDHKTSEGAMAGATIGGTLGAILAAVSTVGAALTIPTMDVAIANPWFAALAGGGAGVASGVLVGALVGYWMVEDRPKRGPKPLTMRATVRRRCGDAHCSDI